MFRLVIKLLVLAVILHAGYRVVPPFWNFMQFRDGVREAATYADTPTFSGRKVTQEQLLERVTLLAEQLKVPVGRDDFAISNDNATTFIDVRYTMQLEYFPRQFYPHEFVVHVEGGASRYKKSTP